MVGGDYRYVRNPMYVAVVGIVLGQALLLASVPLLAYAAVGWLVMASFVRWYEEPVLHETYGSEYDRYREAVRARWPRTCGPGRRPEYASPGGRRADGVHHAEHIERGRRRARVSGEPARLQPHERVRVVRAVVGHRREAVDVPAEHQQGAHHPVPARAGRPVPPRRCPGADARRLTQDRPVVDVHDEGARDAAADLAQPAEDQHLPPDDDGSRGAAHRRMSVEHGPWSTRRSARAPGAGWPLDQRAAPAR